MPIPPVNTIALNLQEEKGAFQSNNFAQVLAHFPEHILPTRRKKRSYISSILSKNEVSRDENYNRKLFLRVKHGHYIINPGLSLRVEGEWRNIYEQLSFGMIAHVHVDQSHNWSDHDFNVMLEQHIERFAKNIKTYDE